jgi:hypothetical protein
MKIEVNEQGDIVLKEVFSGVILETSEGNRLGICMRDDTFEFTTSPKGEQPSWYRVDMSNGQVGSMRRTVTGIKGGPDEEEGLMVAWFANAMAAQELNMRSNATKKTRCHHAVDCASHNTPAEACTCDGWIMDLP